MALKLYPIGIQTFERIRKENLLYIDKTGYVYRMTHTSGKHFFLSRPRRFGKSLLVSTLESYFKADKELFRGLQIENMEREWTEYPVVHFDFSGGKHQDAGQLRRYIGYMLEEEERRFGIECDAVDENVRLENLITSIYEKEGRQVVVLIDEYDAPLLDVAHQDGQLAILRDVMRNFYSPLKKCERMLRFVFITGITKFSQVSIFSELNNITNISMDNEYAGICGITREELLTQMTADVDELARKLSVGREAAVRLLTENYDGYHFAWPSPDVFNPYSLLNCFSRQKVAGYWFATGTPTFLIEMMRKFNTLPADLTMMEGGSDDFDAPTEGMTTIMPLLYQSGYITIKDYDRQFRSYTLSIPNKEVRIGLSKALVPAYVSTNTLVVNNNARNMARCLVKEDIDGMLKLLQTFLRTIPYCNDANSEGHYQQVLYIIFTLLSDYFTDVEVHTPRGRVDMVLRSSSTIYLFELKLNKDAATAIEQINLKDYASKFALCNLPIVKVGINFDPDQRTLSDWKIESHMA